MRFLPTDEQQALRDMSRAFVSTLPGPESMAEHGAAYDPEIWARVMEEAAWPALVVPEAQGGMGLSCVEAMLLFEELGRRMVAAPAFATVGLAVPVLLAAGEAGERWLGAVLGGATATVADGASLHIEPAGDGWTVRGSARRVLDGDSAALLVLVDGDQVVVVDRALVRAERLVGLDPTRPLADVEVSGEVSADAVFRVGDLGPARDMARVLLAAELVGVAESMLDLTVDYSKVRKQFGKPIGSFQAIQHACADMLVQIEAARSAVWYAATALAEGRSDAHLAAATAKALAGDASFAVCGAAIQAHGGIGFTWEHGCHHRFKRARASRGLLGEPAALREEVAAAIFAEEVPWT